MVDELAKVGDELAKVGDELAKVGDELAKVGEHAMERNIQILLSLSCDVMTVLFKLVLHTSSRT